MTSVSDWVRKDLPDCFEFAAQLKEIIDFAVEDDHIAAVSGQHWLITARSGIDYRKPAVAKRDASIPR